VEGNGVTQDDIDRFVEQFPITGGDEKGSGDTFAAAVVKAGQRFRGDQLT
jgi:hypothetical protein